MNEGEAKRERDREKSAGELLGMSNVRARLKLTVKIFVEFRFLAS